MPHHTKTLEVVKRVGLATIANLSDAYCAVSNKAYYPEAILYVLDEVFAEDEARSQPAKNSSPSSLQLPPSSQN